MLFRLAGDAFANSDEKLEDEPNVVVRADPDEVARQYAATLLAEARDELTRADQKASILLAGSGVAAGAILAGMISSGWSPLTLRAPWNTTWIVGALLGLVGIGALIHAIYPRTTRTRSGEPERDDEPQLFYFRQAATMRSVEDLAAELRRSATDPFRRTADQLWRVSQVVGAKYASVRVAIWLLVIGALVMGASGTAHELTK